MGPATIADIEIGTVQLCCRGTPPVENGTTLRLRIDHLLGTADLQPVGMTPSAILIIRRFPDPLPGALTPHHPQVRVNQGWEQAARRSLAEMYRSAVRPSDGVIPIGADAVLFDDEALMLAYLAIDMHAQQVDAHWWWHEMPRTVVPVPASLPILFLRRPALVPAVIHHLAQLERLVPIVNALPPTAANAIVAAMFAAHEITLPDSVRLGDEQAEDNAPSDDAERLWDRWLPPRVGLGDFQPEQARLAAIALGLYHAPAVVRSRPFQQRLAVWWRAIEARDITAPVSESSTSLERGDDEQRQSLRASTEAQHNSQPMSLDPAKQPAEPVQRTDAGTLNDQGVSSTSSETRLLAMPNATQVEVSSSDITLAAEAQWRDPEFESSGSVGMADRSEEETGLRWEGGISTQFGGIGYLINVMCRLNLPDVFEADCSLATTTGPWGTLELLARGMVGDMGVDLTNDRLWDALATLAGRPSGALPCVAADGPTDVQLPVAWPARLGIEPGEVMQGPVSASPLLDGLDEPTRRWLDLSLPYVRKYCRRLLGHDSHGDREVAQTLLSYPGQVYISSTHVDVVLPLDAISIPIRMAGLDRDPGWLPDFGRVVKIHFS